MSRFAAVAVLSLVFALLATPAIAEHDVAAARVEGADRTATAAAAAQLSHPEGAGVALVARADNWPDALAGAPLAGLLDAPILLVGSDEVPEATSQALSDLGVREVVVLGGEAAIGQSVVDTLAEVAHDVRRIAGADRYATAAEVAREIAQDGLGATPGGMRSVILAAGTTFADALAAGAPAALGPHRMPILLTHPDELPAATRAALDELPVEQVLIVGGTAAVSGDVEAGLEDRGLNVVRFAGATRTETAAEVADFAVDILPATAETVHIARGDDFPDALAAGPLAASMHGPLLLTEGPEQLGEPAARWLASRCADVSTVRAVGGTAAIAASVLQQAEQAAEDCHEPGITGTPLAYLSRTGDPLTLNVVEEPGAEPTVVADDVLPGATYDWSPDATEIVYPRTSGDLPGESQLVITAADGSAQRAITSAGESDRFPVFSPDAQEVAFVRGPADAPGGGVHVVSRDAGEPRLIVAEEGVQPFNLSWSPDGERIAYQRMPEGELAQPQIAIVDVDTRQVEVITEGQLSSATWPAWSPDGELLALVGTEEPAPAGSTALYVIHPDGTGLEQLTGEGTEVEGFQPAWSPDGQYLAFAQRAGELLTSDLAVIRRDGSDQRVLADERTIEADPTWSPDGTTIAFISAFTEGDSDVYTIMVDGTGLQAVTDSGLADSPRFAPGSDRPDGSGT